jgi:hypothetical protein
VQLVDTGHADVDVPGAIRTLQPAGPAAPDHDLDVVSTEDGKGERRVIPAAVPRGPNRIQAADPCPVDRAVVDARGR